MSALTLPEPSGFRTFTMPRSAPAELFAARLVHEHVDFNYSSDFECNHQFIYAVKYHKTVMEIVDEFFKRQERKTPKQTADAKAKMAGTIRQAYRDSWL